MTHIWLNMIKGNSMNYMFHKVPFIKLASSSPNIFAVLLLAACCCSRRPLQVPISLSGMVHPFVRANSFSCKYKILHQVGNILVSETKDVSNYNACHMRLIPFYINYSSNNIVLNTFLIQIDQFMSICLLKEEFFNWLGIKCNFISSHLSGLYLINCDGGTFLVR